MNAAFRSPAFGLPVLHHAGALGSGLKVILSHGRSDPEIAWAQAAQAPGLDPALWRIDAECRVMRRDACNDQADPHGWTVRPRDPRSPRDEGDDAPFEAVAYASLE